MPNLFEEFRAVVGVLSAARIPYAICGGIAMSIHAHPRATIDIDLLAPPDAVEQIVESLLPHGFVRRERAPIRLAKGEVVMHQLTEIVPGDPEVLSLDVIEVQPGATGDAWQTRTSTEWEGHSVTGGFAHRPHRPQEAPRLATGHGGHRPARGARLTRAERAVLATSQARDLCLSLQRAFIGPRALQRLRAGEAALMPPAELRVALGLAWAASDVPLVRAALASVPADRIAADPVLSAFLDATR